jgi:hypothetical protein
VIVLQMILLGTGMGLSTAPATESILGVVRPEQAGVGSAVNDAIRLVGGTLGVAILGSVYASLYRAKVATAVVPQAAREAAKGSYGASSAVIDVDLAGDAVLADRPPQDLGQAVLCQYLPVIVADIGGRR